MKKLGPEDVGSCWFDSERMEVHKWNGKTWILNTEATKAYRELDALIVDSIRGRND